VKPKDFVISQLIVGSCMVCIQAFEFTIFITIFRWSQFSWNFVIGIGSIFLMIGFLGMLYGVLLSISMKTVFASYLLSQFSILPVYFISGEMIT
jgi:hypothetical protein